MDNIKSSRGSYARQPHGRLYGSDDPSHRPTKNKKRHSGQKYWLVRSIGKVASKRRQSIWAKFKASEFARWPFKNYLRRAYVIGVAGMFLLSVVATIVQPFIEDRPYRVSEEARAVLPKKNIEFGKLLKENAQDEKFVYNENFAGTSGSITSGSNQPRFEASFSSDPSKGVQVSDKMSNVDFGLVPKFRLDEAKKEDNQIFYRLMKQNGYVVYTARSASVKEDILLESYDKDSITFEFELTVANGVEARLEKDGSIGVYGSDLPINGNVSAGTDADKQLLEKARQNSKKNKLLFRVPAPVVIESEKQPSKAQSHFELEGTTLKIVTTNLLQANYPLSIDPTIYVETAAKLMRGNNETNTDFDIDNELIQKSQTTGARINAWEQNLDMSQGAWDVATAAAGGYVYRSGGRTGPSKPQIVAQQETLDGSNGTTFQMNMPTSRPAGDLYIAVMCKDQNAGRSVTMTEPVGGGWTEFADTGEFSGYYKIGSNVSGGNEAASYTWTTSASEQMAGIIVRVTNFNSSTPVTPTPTTNNSGASNNQPVFPAITPSNDATLIIRAAGADNDNPSATGWVPSGHTKIGSARSSASGGCAYAAASLDTPPASGVSTGTATYADTSITDQWGSGTIAINPATYTTATQTEVSWAKFNSSSLAIESPNPGAGACSGWCSDSAYALPSARRGHSMVAYNGYLYVIGGLDGSGNRTSTIYIAKLGANGEPQLWHPTGGTAAYWYSDTGLSGGTARSYLAAAAYNNRLYLVGGQTNAASGGVTTVEYANINPTGTLGSWNPGTALPAGAGTHMHTVHIYNDVLYTIGGFEGAATSSANMRSAVYYAKINSSGSLNAWIATESFSGARATLGGNFSAVWGAYIYLAGGCTAVNGSGYCTTVSSTTQLASINADGSIAPWNEILNLSNQRVGYSFIAWQGGLYRFGGCAQQDTSSGNCISTLADVDYGVINPDGDASTVNNSEPSGTAPCSGGSPTNCDLPPPGDSAGQGGQMSSMVVINNGFIYNIGGCVTASSSCSSNMSGNISYSAISTTGALAAPSTCSGTSYGHWCVDSTNRINGTAGLGAAGTAVFNNVIYVAGGTNSLAWQSSIWRVGLNADGSLTGAWTSQTFASVGLTGTADDARGYMYMFTRANPAAVATNPGNLYMLGGCSATSGIGCSTYHSDTIKCNIDTAGAVNTCTTTGQLQIDADNINGGNQGLGLMAGTIYANRIYLVGGSCSAVGSANDPCGSNYAANRKDTIFAKIDDSNNIVAQSGGVWQFATAQMDPVRRRAVSFGYNGYIYSLAGYSGAESLQDLLFSRIDVSTGDMGPWSSSGVVVTPRWDLRAAVSNGYVYAIGGCAALYAPAGCTDMQEEVQTFQLYNNDSGAVNNFTAQSDQTFTASTDRWGASAAILNGYLYVGGGCISATDCTSVTSSVEYAPISANDGSVGTWAAGGSMPGGRAWGSLEAVAGTLYWIAGQTSGGSTTSSNYYTTSISSGNPTWGTTTATLSNGRKQFSTAVWNNRIYLVGGLNVSNVAQTTVYVSPQQNSGGNITGSWTSTTQFNVGRAGAAVTAYANNLYVFGGFDGTNYLNDVQFTQINSDGTVDAWQDTTSLPTPLRDSRAVSANGYIYLIGGRSAASTCIPKVLVTPISANTTIASGNNPTGVGEWYETNVRYSGDRYGAAVAYDKGKIYTMGGGCTAPLSTNRHYYSTVKSQPQVALYSRMIDADTDVFPNSWLMNGIDNSIGARWQAKYRSMNDNDGVPTDCGTADMSTWGQETNFGDVTLGTVNSYTPLDGSGNNVTCARYYYFFVTIDASKTFGYPEDVDRGPTIADLSLFFTSDPSKRLKHGKTFTGGEQQPLDTPCRQSGGQANCPLP